MITLLICPAQAKNDSDKLDEITKLILQKELELQRLNTSFQVQTTLVSPWRQRRVFLYGETNASCTEAGLLLALPVRYKLAREKFTPGVIPEADIDADEELPDIVSGRVINSSQRNRNRTLLAAAARTQLVGQLVGVGGDIFELTLNFINYQSLKRKGFSPAMYEKRVHSLHIELDTLLAQRQSLLTSSTISQAELSIIQAEGKLLNDLRDLSLIEYSKLHSATKRFWAFQNTAFLVDLVKNSTGASANIINLAANHLRRPRMQGGAGVLNTVSGAIVLLTPIVGRVTGNLSGLAAERTTSKELTNIQSASAETYALHKQQFLAVTADKPNNTRYCCGAHERLKLYEIQEKLLANMSSYVQKQRERGRGTLRENIVFASIVGPPRIANGITSILGGWRYYRNPPTANKVYAGGMTAYLAGTSFNMFETARVQASIELHNRKLAKKHLLPKQQFEQRLQTLSELDEILTH